jgi:hypothetical protein
MARHKQSGLEPEQLVTKAKSADGPRTRRAVLTGGAAAAIALMGEAIVRPAPASAASVSLGGTNNATTATVIQNTAASSTAKALIGRTTYTGGGGSTIGVLGESLGNQGTGVKGRALTGLNAKGVWGVADTGTGVRGTANTGSTASGVLGESTQGAGVRGNGTNNYGVFGTGGYCGTRGQGGTYGSISSGTSVGAYGSGSDYGLYGAGGSYGVYGGGSAYGLYGSGPTGVYGSGSNYGVVGTTTNLNTDAVRGDGGQYGVHGLNGRTAGTRGDSGYVGAWGQATSYGVYGLATDGANTSYGVFGQASNVSSYGVWCQGNMHVAGTLSKAAGSFKIDHPLDPEARWLSHSFVESPDMMNVYNGIAVLDTAGSATVRLPAYFDALNRDFRYQLTAVGGAAPSLHVLHEVAGNAFVIAGGSSGQKVSWQVTGIRQDDYAKEHPIVVETAKGPSERGTREFVPRGSAARQMIVGPARGNEKQESLPQPVPPQVHPQPV